MPTIESTVTVSELAKLLRVSQRSVWRLLATEQAPSPFRIGRRVRFRASEVNDWIAAGCPAREAFTAQRGGKRAQ